MCKFTLINKNKKQTVSTQPQGRVWTERYYNTAVQDMYKDTIHVELEM
jgi:methionine salvage enolase-phosphatase E1